MRLFSTEQISKYHPDKVADQISDAILTECLRQDKNSRVACETMIKDYTVVLGGEITTKADFNAETIVKKVMEDLDYKCDKVINLLNKQSSEIANCVNDDVDEVMGAGDQGFMIGYACRDTENMLPYGFDLANKIIEVIETDVMMYDILKGDTKCQVTVDLDKPRNKHSIHTILISACHSEDYGVEYIRRRIRTLVENQLGLEGLDIKWVINPSGRWTIGGAVADCGLTGRKIVCDQYGGYAEVGGGAFSGKDLSKVDRSAAYMARYLAKRILKGYTFLDEVKVQIAYAIGVNEPISVNVIIPNSNLHGLEEHLSNEIINNFDLTPYGIIKYLDLKDVDYYKVSQGCHYRDNSFEWEQI